MRAQTMAVIMAMLAAGLGLQGCSVSNKKDETSATTDPTPVKPALPLKISGGYYQIAADGQVDDEGTASGENLAALSVGDKTLSLTAPGVSAGGMTQLTDVQIDGQSYRQFLVSSSQYKHTKFGLITLENAKTLAFAQGRLSPEVPKTGQSIYNGDAAVVIAAQGEDKGYSGAATAISSVDFGQKSVAVTISTLEKTPREINLNATISGSEFRGDQKGIISYGGFYGQEAEEMGGYFVSKKNYGAFGGKKFIGVGVK